MVVETKGVGTKGVGTKGVGTKGVGTKGVGTKVSITFCIVNTIQNQKLIICS